MDFQGFSLLEVLISLMLAAGMTLTLMHQQWNISRFFNELLIEAQNHHIWKNQQEIGNP